MKGGDRARIIAPGQFFGWVGTIVPTTAGPRRSSRFVRLVIDGHPWQRDGVTWAFELRELEKCDGQA